MANKILTPVTLWSDFDDSLPPTETVLREWEENGAVFSAIRYQGRETEAGRVDIFALFAKPKEPENCPVLLVLPDAGQTADEELLRFFVAKGYAVLMPDYRGAWANTEEYTVYPQCVAYANYAQAGLHLDYAEPSAKETSWYEWVAVARYSAQYLAARFPSSKLGAVGIKAGGETALMLAGTYGKLSCAILVCAGGWRAYRGVHKFGDNAAELKMNDERHRFLAGADAQAYAQYAKCPVLMLCSTNDERFDADRAFDTFARINPEMDKTFYFAARYDGCIGKTGQNDLFLFLDKYLKEREVFIPSPAEVSIEEDGGELAARVKFDKNGEVTYCEVFMAEDNPDSASRDWAKCALKREDGEDEQIFDLSAYEGASRVFVFAKTKYSCGFAVSSKIAVKRLEKKLPEQLAQKPYIIQQRGRIRKFRYRSPGRKRRRRNFFIGQRVARLPERGALRHKGDLFALRTQAFPYQRCAVPPRRQCTDQVRSVQCRTRNIDRLYLHGKKRREGGVRLQPSSFGRRTLDRSCTRTKGFQERRKQAACTVRRRKIHFFFFGKRSVHK